MGTPPEPAIAGQCGEGESVRSTIRRGCDSASLTCSGSRVVGSRAHSVRNPIVLCPRSSDGAARRRTRAMHRDGHRYVRRMGSITADQYFAGVIGLSLLRNWYVDAEANEARMADLTTVFARR